MCLFVAGVSLPQHGYKNKSTKAMVEADDVSDIFDMELAAEESG